MPSTVTDPVETRLSEILSELRAIRVALERPQRPASVLTRADQAMLEKILPAIAGARGSELFLATELLEDDAPAVRLVCRGLTARQLGRLLRRATNVPIDGRVIQRVAVEAGAVVWRVMQVPGVEI